ncbi:MAG: hypothetical protein AB7T22_05230 [Calditrichaceae bacterium]
MLHKENNRMDHLQSGFGSARLGLKYKVPLNTDNFDIAGRLAFHVPMGADFAIHPSYPYDNEEYGIEAMLIQTYRFSPSWKLHFNEAYRWQGLRDDKVDDDLLITSGAIVNVRGIAIDSDGDGIPDGIDLEPRTAAGAKVDSKGRILSPMELELLTKGLLRVHKI